MPIGLWARIPFVVILLSESLHSLVNFSHSFFYKLICSDKMPQLFAEVVYVSRNDSTSVERSCSRQISLIQVKTRPKPGDFMFPAAG